MSTLEHPEEKVAVPVAASTDAKVPVNAGAVADAETPQDPAELQARLAHLKASATKEEALKDYAAAADHYSEATEIQAQLNGEMSVDNADLLYLYGRCLYRVAVSKSDVLGGKVAGEDSRKRKRESKPDGPVADSTSTAETKTDDANATDPSKPYFQIEGDENWVGGGSEDVSEGEAADGEEQDADDDDDDDDDFATAYEILDVARVLLTRKIEQAESTGSHEAGKGKQPETRTPAVRSTMERLADTRDLQAEISLENERFTDAIADSRASLEIKQQLFPLESSLIAEAHFKLSLALEFASVTTVAEANDAEGADVVDKNASIDEEKRKEAAEHMDKAIESCRSRVEKEKAVLAAETAGSEKHASVTKSVEDVEDMIKDMESRLTDLRNPSVTVNGMDESMAGGLLGSLMGGAKVDMKEAIKSANDLTGMVRSKNARTSGEGVAAAAAAATDVATAAGVNGVSSGNKRKADDDEEPETNGKKAKVEETA